MKKGKVEVLYLAVEADLLSLPVAVFDSLSAVAKWENCSLQYMRLKIKKHLKSADNKYYFERVICRE